MAEIEQRTSIPLPEQNWTRLQALLRVAASLLVVAGLYASSLSSYLLFHTLIELFSIVVSFAIFVVAWNTRRVQENHYLFFLGIALLFTGFLELLHTLAYKGLGVFPGHDANLPTQLWIAFRYLLGGSFLSAPFFIKRRLYLPNVTAGYAAITAVLTGTIFLGLFPDCFIEGRGLTQFKIVSEYIIILLFLASLGLLVRNRESFDRTVLRLMAGAILASVLSEVSFTRYVSVFGLSNMIGHFFLLISVGCIYRAIVVTGIVEPASLLFRDLKLKEEKISRLNEELGRNVAQLEASNRELEAFSYTVSHDLRSPLRVISGLSQALLEDHAERLDDEGRGRLERVRLATRRMGHLIDDLLAFSQISRSEIRRSDVDLSSLARDVAADLRAADPERTAELLIADGLEGNGDERLLRVVIENLLGNAWKFTRNRVRPVIEFGIEDCGGERRYYVWDNGVGFDMTHAATLFRPFQRLHRAQEFPGTGIGLATVRRIIERHGGRIGIDSEPDGGTVVYFSL